MADLFQCDRCKVVLPKTGKRGRLIIQELNPHDQQPHASLYNQRAEVCVNCFGDLRTSFAQSKSSEPSFVEASSIMRDANAIVVSDITKPVGGL